MPGKETILVVDDDREIVRATMLRLVATGYKPIAAYDGVEAMQRMIEECLDAVLLDVRMPGLDGLAVLEQMRKSPELSKLPVIMLSASLRDQHKAIKAGARLFLTKPHRGDDLLEALSFVLTATSHEEPPAAPIPQASSTG